METNLVSQFIAMRQPELGKVIARLRKQKGLTQEELVDLCNINVRTIQRIEAGEVNPRSYTIKNIIEALDADEEFVKSSSIELPHDSFSEEEVSNEYHDTENNADAAASSSHKADTVKESEFFKVLNRDKVKSSFICGIIYLALSIPQAFMSIARGFDALDADSIIFYLPMHIAGYVLFVFFLRGLIEIADFKNLTTLSQATSLFQYLWAIIVLFDLISYMISGLDGIGTILITIVYILLYVALMAYFYYHLYNQGSQIAAEAKYAGIAGLVAVIMFATLILSPFAGIAMIVAEIFLLITLHKYSQPAFTGSESQQAYSTT